MGKYLYLIIIFYFKLYLSLLCAFLGMIFVIEANNVYWYEYLFPQASQGPYTPSCIFIKVKPDTEGGRPKILETITMQESENIYHTGKRGHFELQENGKDVKIIALTIRGTSIPKDNFDYPRYIPLHTGGEGTFDSHWPH